MSEITTKRAFIEALQSEFPEGTTLKETEAAVEAVGRAVSKVVKGLKDGEKAVIPGIGALHTKTSNARKARNPRTGEAVDVPPQRKLIITPAANLRNIAAEG